MPKAKPQPPEDSTIKQSASQIWLAGLGAFAKAQEQGGKVFESLVREGMEMQRKTQSAATERMNSLAQDLSSRATGQWDRLGNLFEDRVARALHQLGVPSADEIEALKARIDALERAQESRKRPAPAKNGERPAAAKAAPRRTTSRKPE
jgi:poly(hydroxyalkanoate) granule-associated protein